MDECQTLSDEQVVDRVCAGESGLYELLMRRYNQRVYRVVRSVLTTDEESEDVLQEAWVRAYVHLDQFKGSAAFSTWVTKIALYEALARARKSKRWKPLESPEGEIMPHPEAAQTPAETPEAQAMRAQLGQILQSAMDQLPESYRTVFVLREVENLSTSETAECLGVSQEAVKTRLHRARALLRRDLQDRAGSLFSEAYSFMGVRCDRSVARVMSHLPRARVECGESDSTSTRSC